MATGTRHALLLSNNIPKCSSYDYKSQYKIKETKVNADFHDYFRPSSTSQQNTSPTFSSPSCQIKMPQQDTSPTFLTKLPQQDASPKFLLTNFMTKHERILS